MITENMKRETDLHLERMERFVSGTEAVLFLLTLVSSQTFQLFYRYNPRFALFNGVNILIMFIIKGSAILYSRYKLLEGFGGCGRVYEW